MSDIRGSRAEPLEKEGFGCEKIGSFSSKVDPASLEVVQKSLELLQNSNYLTLVMNAVPPERYPCQALKGSHPSRMQPSPQDRIGCCLNS